MTTQPLRGDSDDVQRFFHYPIFYYYFVTSARPNTLIDEMIKNVETIRKTHQGFWFSPDTMKFFRSCIEADGTVYGGRYFVTSEKGPSGRRAYTVREYDLREDWISTVGEFMEYPTLEDAVEKAKELGSR